MHARASRNVLTLAAVLFFLLYLGLVLFKSSVSFGENEISFSGDSRLLACGADCMRVAQGFLHYGIFDHLRTASVSLLIGLVLGASCQRREIAVAMAICGPIVALSAVLGEVQWVVRLLLVAIGTAGTVEGLRLLVGGGQDG